MVRRMSSINEDLPRGLSQEPPARNLASLTLTDSLRQATATIVGQWQCVEAFEDLRRFGIYPIRQVLFYGPPGNGKTTACQWLAGKLDVPLYRVRCEQVVEALMGETAANIGRMMDWLDRNGQPAVILLDEVEQLFPSRDSISGGTGREVNSAMTVFWQRLDRWKHKQLFVFATNKSDSLDEAMMSRIELKLRFGPPTAEQAKLVIGYWAETLHEYSSDDWAPRLIQMVDGGDEFESFRELWQIIQAEVVGAVVKEESEI